MIKVLINAQVVPRGQWGGVEQLVMGLVHGLGRLTDGDEEYVLVALPEYRDWLRPHLGPNQRVEVCPRPRVTRVESAKELLGPLRRPAGKVWRASRRLISRDAALNCHGPRQSDGFLESLGGDVVHFPYQHYVRSGIPAIFNPHDLQHLHYPHFFSEADVRLREIHYRSACNEARAIVTESAAVKDDLVRQYGLEAEKIAIVTRGAPTDLYSRISPQEVLNVRNRLDLPALFAFFPAQTWPHKNHIRLLEAIRLLRDRGGVCLNLVCTGLKNAHWPQIERRVTELGLDGQVRFLGYVTSTELRALYQLTQFVVYPSLFEGGGFPVVEGMKEGVPVACSDIRPLMEYGGDAVLPFDPNSTDSIAASLLRMHEDKRLREQLCARGKERARAFTWERTGKTYRALYRKVAGVPMSEEDVRLLGGDTVETEDAKLPA